MGDGEGVGGVVGEGDGEGVGGVVGEGEVRRKTRRRIRPVRITARMIFCLRLRRERKDGFFVF